MLLIIIGKGVWGIAFDDDNHGRKGRMDDDSMMDMALEAHDGCLYDSRCRKATGTTCDSTGRTRRNARSGIVLFNIFVHLRTMCIRHSPGRIHPKLLSVGPSFLAP